MKHTACCFQFVSEKNTDDPLQETFIGPEKLLSLYSEMNWGNYCLSYLLTSRDFSGVLGLAWEGKPGEICLVHQDQGLMIVNFTNAT